MCSSWTGFPRWIIPEPSPCHLHTPRPGSGCEKWALQNFISSTFPTPSCDCLALVLVFPGEFLRSQAHLCCLHTPTSAFGRIKLPQSKEIFTHSGMRKHTEHQKDKTRKKKKLHMAPKHQNREQRESIESCKGKATSHLQKKIHQNNSWFLPGNVESQKILGNVLQIPEGHGWQPKLLYPVKSTAII